MFHVQLATGPDFDNIMDFTVNIDRPHLANLLGEVMDKIIEFQKF